MVINISPTLTGQMRLHTACKLTYMDKAHEKQELNAVRRSWCPLVPSMTSDSDPSALSRTLLAECLPLNHPLLPTPSTYQPISQCLLPQNTAKLYQEGQKTKPPSLIILQLHQILNDFLNSFTSTHSRRFSMK